MQKNISRFLLAGAVTQIDGKYFAADLDSADLLKFVSTHPIIFWITLGAIVIICVILAIYHFAKKGVVQQ